VEDDEDMVETLLSAYYNNQVQCLVTIFSNNMDIKLLIIEENPFLACFCQQSINSSGNIAEASATDALVFRLVF
jgi:hypothetical protein